MNLPDWIEEETWQAFEEMRHRIKKPLTDFARKRIIQKLGEFHAQGYKADEILGESVERCWCSVFLYQDAPRRNLSTAEHGNVVKISAMAGSAIKRPT